MGITRELARYIAGARFEDIPQNVVRLARQLVLDEIGCAFGGQFTDEVKIFTDFVKADGGKPEATIVGVGSKVPAISAAGANGFAANTLDYEETYRNYVHPAFYPVWVSIALAERQGASGKDVITGIVTGYDIVNRLGDALRASLEFRKTNENFSYLSFGAMTAAAKILGLDENQTCDAIGITGYTAPLVNLNLWLKGLPSSPIKGAVHWHCQTGIEAALLAQKGFMGPPNILDKKEWGFWAGVSDKCDWDMITYKLGEEFYLEKYLSFKPWSCCRWLHQGIGMLLELLEKEKFDPMDIEEIVYKIHSSLISYAPFHVQMPKDAFESMYSIPWTFATMALGYQPGPDWFARERQDDPRVRELVKRIRLEEDPEVTRLHDEDPDKSFARLSLRAKGKVYERQAEYAKGDPQKPMKQQEIEGKFSSMAERIVSDKQVKRTIDTVNHLEDLGNLKELTQDFARSA